MFEKVKQEIKKLEGIISCKITGNGEIDEIHIIADKKREAKRIVRDIETIVLVNEDREINHKKISIAQVDRGQSLGEKRKIKIQSIYQEHGAPVVHIKLMIGGNIVKKKREGSPEDPVYLLVAQGMIEIIGGYVDLKAKLRLENIFTTGINNQILIVQLALCNNNFQEGEKLIGAVYINNNLALAAGKACLKALNRKITQ